MMGHPVRAVLITTLALTAAFGLSACGFGEEGVSLSESNPDYRGAQLFAANCAGCHTLTPAGAEGTGNRSTRVQGPNLDQRVETIDSTLFAIKNGGYSGAIMPQNIVVGDEADEVARFVAKYAGSDAGE
jgi:mono/diheme cytochrome c family protein